MKIAIIIIASVQIFIDIWCVCGILDHTTTLKVILEIMEEHEVILEMMEERKAHKRPKNEARSTSKHEKSEGEPRK